VGDVCKNDTLNMDRITSGEKKEDADRKHQALQNSLVYDSKKRNALECDSIYHYYDDDTQNKHKNNVSS
jgi:hypothetical protein